MNSSACPTEISVRILVKFRDHLLRMAPAPSVNSCIQKILEKFWKNIFVIISITIFIIIFQTGTLPSKGESTRGKARHSSQVKFIYSEKTTKFCEISTNHLSYVLPVKNLMEICKIVWPAQNIWSLIKWCPIFDSSPSIIILFGYLD